MDNQNSLLGRQGKTKVINKLQIERGKFTTPNDIAIYLFELFIHFSSKGAKLREDAKKRNKLAPKIILSKILVNTSLILVM